MSSDPSTPGSSGEPIISVRNVGKCYDIFARPSHRLLRALKAGGPGSEKYVRRFWALQSVSFDLHRGEAVGIIGRNGSGKSTLMQIIAGTLAPTTGEVHIRGRIAALLELGSGFNSEFTGRENAYLSGAILGIPRKAMDERIAEIEEFAEIGDFFDQPIDTYSSGMNARLAFSVAVNVQPEILILDEVLSVGDASFQQKCIGRMRQLLSGGVTLLFVSHNADAVKSICNKGLFLVRGKPAHFGTSEEAVNHYINHLRGENNQRVLTASPNALPTPEAATPELSLTPALEVLPQAPGPADITPDDPDLDDPTPIPEPKAGLRYGSGQARVLSVRLTDEDGTPRKGFRHAETIVLEAVVRAEADLDRADLAFMVRDKVGVDVFGSSALEEGANLPTLRADQPLAVRFRFKNILRAGTHGISLTLTQRPSIVGSPILTLDHQDACAAFVCISEAHRRVRGKVSNPVKVECQPLCKPPPAPPTPHTPAKAT